MLSVEQLTVYYGSVRIVDGVSLAVAPGRVVCLLGRNGVGKTTLMKAIMGVLVTRSGRILLDGREIGALSPSERARAGIGYVPQGRGIFPHLTVHENILMGFEATPAGKPDGDAIERVVARFPVLAQMRSRQAGTLSGGQQQQLALARALVARPRVLLLDEPTEGIQPSILLEIEDVIASLRERDQLAILLVEQRLDFALNVADDYYIMETGAIAAQGPVAAFDHAAAKELLSL